MKRVHVILEGMLSPKVRGMAFFVACAAAAVALVVAGLSDGKPGDASANAIAGDPPIVKADLTDAPQAGVARTNVAGPMRPVMATPIPSDPKALVRRLQTALANARCYDGPISGAWSDRSKDAMRGFIVAVNAQLPVDDPDPALLALVESNSDAACRPGGALTTGTIAPPAQAPVDIPDRPREEANLGAPIALAVKPEPQSKPPTEDRPLIERAWAPPGMLEIPRSSATTAAAPPADTSDSIIVGSSGRDQPPDPSAPPTPSKPAATKTVATATLASTDSVDSPSDNPPSTSNSRKIEFVPDPTVPDEPPRQKTGKQKADNRKTKTAKSKRPKSESYSQSISGGLQSLQRQLSSFFN